MLKITNRLELISDTDTCLFIDKGMRGVISYIAKIHSKANHKYINISNHMILINKARLLCI